jgi:hypothetical protein
MAKQARFIDKQVARFLFADDFEFAQGNEKRFANTKGHLASGFICCRHA